MLRLYGWRSQVCRVAALTACLLALPVPRPALAQAPTPDGGRVVEFRFTPASNAQIALWLEDAKGTFLATVGLTEAVATRGIGNRPGASQMNSGFRWPYGRREGVLPIWAHRRASAPGAKPFRRVIFQNRTSEGDASRTSDDASRDDYFCLSFANANSAKDALDAVSCASVFNSDKGRFITAADVRAGYAEPYEDLTTHLGRMQPLTADSLYPPRRDVRPCAGLAGCVEHADVASYDDHAREIMPDIDAVSMATPKGGQPQHRLFSVPAAWPDGQYRACLEINVEGDYNASFDDKHFPTPTTPSGSWDIYTRDYGYPYRGQPSAVYCVPFALSEGNETAAFSSDRAVGSSDSWDTASAAYGALAGMDGMSDDPVGAPGSGADRLHRDLQGARLSVLVKPALTCGVNAAPSGIAGLVLQRYPDELRAHEWAELDFLAASDDTGVFRYDVRVSTEPITDDESFLRGMPAKSATIAADELRVPVDGAAGSEVQTDFGGLVAETHYYVAVRAIDGCAASGPFAVAEITTPKRVFATVSPCFVATAAYGTPLAREISVLRRFRDRQLANQVLGRAFVAAYGVIGPRLAHVIRESEGLRAISRALLEPAVSAARLLTD